jgi:DNA anti-recombination protein RmuC
MDDDPELRAALLYLVEHVGNLTARVERAEARLASAEKNVNEIIDQTNDAFERLDDAIERASQDDSVFETLARERGRAA